MLYKKKCSDRIINFGIVSLLILLCLATIVPFMQVIAISLSPPEIASQSGLHLFPTKVVFEGYYRVIKHALIWKAYGNTIVRTLLGTALSVSLTLLGAYPLSKKYLPHRNLWTGIIVFTMYFSGGLIPSYLLVKNLKLMNTLGALILPGAVNTFNLIVTRNFLMTLPESLEESAKIDGAGDLTILIRIILPLSTPIIATIALWYGVGHWNSWFDCMLYINDSTKFVLQYVLRLILMEGQTEDLSSDTQIILSTETMKMATLMVATLPIICVYPFLQKYFVKGMLVGSLKG
jgi:putative aldouronate transport system permease protein